METIRLSSPTDSAPRPPIRQQATALASLLLDETPKAKAWRGEAAGGGLKSFYREKPAGEPKPKRIQEKPILRIHRSKLHTNSQGFTQAEVALLLNLSERSVREIEKRAVRKLRAHPALREVWRQFLAGELEESASQLSPHEVAALFRLTRTSAERQVLRKVLRLVQR